MGDCLPRNRFTIVRLGQMIFITLAAAVNVAAADEPAWSVDSYPDEAGYQARIAGVIPAWAEVPFGMKQKAYSRCPDTGLPVRSWALQGETIYSPYTGRAYEQGHTGYFGPKQRGTDGRITAFGGDPLKRDLPPAIAYLLLNRNDPAVEAFLGIPGNLSQQYHFAAVNWARFYPLLAKDMSEQWRHDFQQAVADYQERRRPSDGDREHAPLSLTHNLVGYEGELLGGPVKEGGTENHKTMWRSAGLLYAQWFGPEAKISGHDAPKAERLISRMFQHYLQLTLTYGNGEYDSSSYYPHSLNAFWNLYDFSPDPDTRRMAKAMIDYYLVTYGLKVYNGYFTGAQKRGFTGSGEMREMDRILWAYLPQSSAAKPHESNFIPVHQATGQYRPNRVISNIITKNLALPFEAWMRRPTYHVRKPNAFHEYFYCDTGYAMGSVAMTRVDNPTQQTIWTLNTAGDDGSLIFGGGQPFYRSPEGHSPYSQVLQKRGAIVIMTGPTAPRPAGQLQEHQRERYKHASGSLKRLPLQTPAAQRWEQAGQLAETWLFVPIGAELMLERDGWMIFDAGTAFVAVRGLGDDRGWFHETPGYDPESIKRLREGYQILIDLGEYSGFIVEAANRDQYDSAAAFADALAKRTTTKLQKRSDGRSVLYESLAGDEIRMRYRGDSVRADGRLNGQAIDWDAWADGQVYKSPYLQVGSGRMWVSDGREAYEMDYRSGQPRWRAASTDPTEFTIDDWQPEKHQ